MNPRAREVLERLESSCAGSPDHAVRDAGLLRRCALGAPDPEDDEGLLLRCSALAMVAYDSPHVASAAARHADTDEVQRWLLDGAAAHQAWHLTGRINCYKEATGAARS